MKTEFMTLWDGVATAARSQVMTRGQRDEMQVEWTGLIISLGHTALSSLSDPGEGGGRPFDRGAPPTSGQ